MKKRINPGDLVMFDTVCSVYSGSPYETEAPGIILIDKGTIAIMVDDVPRKRWKHFLTAHGCVYADSNWVSLV